MPYNQTRLQQCLGLHRYCFLFDLYFSLFTFFKIIPCCLITMTTVIYNFCISQARSWYLFIFSRSFAFTVSFTGRFSTKSNSSVVQCSKIVETFFYYQGEILIPDDSTSLYDFIFVVYTIHSWTTFVVCFVHNTVTPTIFRYFPFTFSLHLILCCNFLRLSFVFKVFSLQISIHNFKEEDCYHCQRIFFSWYFVFMIPYSPFSLNQNFSAGPRDWTYQSVTRFPEDFYPLGHCTVEPWSSVLL